MEELEWAAGAHVFINCINPIIYCIVCNNPRPPQAPAGGGKVNVKISSLRDQPVDYSGLLPDR